MTSLMGLAHGKGKGHAASPPNLIRNGSFVGGISGWVTPDDVSWIAASWDAGALLLVSSEDNSYVRANYQPGDVLFTSLGGLTELDIVGTATATGTDPAAAISFDFAANAEGTGDLVNVVYWGNAMPPGVANVLEARAMAVPEGMTHAFIGLICSELGANGNCRFDDVYVGPVGQDQPPYPPT